MIRERHPMVIIISTGFAVKERTGIVMKIRAKRKYHNYLAFILVVVMLFSYLSDYVRTRAAGDQNDPISDLTITFEDGADYVDGRYVWTPTEDVANHQFIYRLTYSFNDVSGIEAGDVKIYLPKHILKARNDVYADLCELPMTELSEATGGNEFAYYMSGDYIIITNVTRSIQSSGIIDIAYTTSRTTYSYKDLASSDAPHIMITLSRNGTVIDSDEADAEPFYIDTSAELVSVQKTASSQRYISWDSTWGEEPEDSSDYYYIIWTVVTKVNATQPFTIRLTDQFNEPDSDIVGYRMSGRSVFSNQNQAYCSNLPDSSRHDQILTRHLKSSYTAEQYEQYNYCDVELIPADEPENASSMGAEAMFRYDRPKFIIPTHGFNAWKYGNSTWTEKFDSAWDVADYELTEFVSGARDAISGNVKYCIDTVVNPYYDTLPEDADPNDPTQYGQELIYYYLEDDRVYFNDAITTNMEEITIPDGTVPITYEDYEIDHIDYEFIFKDAYLNTETMTFDEKYPVYAEDEKLYFEGKFDGSDEWTWFGTIWLRSREITFDSDHVRSLTLKKVVFKENCTAYRITTANVHYKSMMTAYPYYRVKRSENIMNIINSSLYSDEKAWLTNTGTFEVKNSRGKVLYYKDIIGRDYFIGYKVNSSISKRLFSFDNNNADKYATLGWKIDMKESYFSNDGEQYIPQNSGTFYDLLPMGSEVNLSTVAVQTEEGYLDFSAFDVSTIINYRNTGRTMLIVKLKEQFLHASLTFDLIYSWESVVDYGKLVTNSVAYETGNEAISDGYPDDGGSLTYAHLMSDLDPDTDDEKFIYAEAGHMISILLLADSGLTKTVKNASEHIYRDTSLVHQNGEYTYKLRYSANGGISTKNLILYDSLENYTDDDRSSSWHGTLKGVDASQPALLGADPVVYVSSIGNLDIIENRDLDAMIGGQRVWETEEDFIARYGSLDNAKAIAVDIRNNTQGESFILPPEDSIAILIYMQGPPSDNSGEEDPKAYNSVHASYTTTDEINYTKDVFTEKGYTELILHIMADVNIVKVSTEDNTTPIKGISFRLSGTSDYGTRTDETLLTDINGRISFGDIEKGTYILTEVEGNDEFLPIETPIVVVIDENGIVSYDGVSEMEGVYHTIGDIPRLYANISFFKRDITVPQLFIEGARFELTGTSDYGHEVTLYAQTDSNGLVSFNNLELGTYKMRETATDGDHILDGNVYTVSVTGRNLYSITVDQTQGTGDSELLTTGVSGAYSICNEPYHRFTIQKNAYADQQPIRGAVFELKGQTTGGAFVDITKTTGITGRITFERMESGTYTLQEIFAPYGFALDLTVRTVTIDKYGNVTISDSETDVNGYFIIENKENGVVTITKKWLDGLTNEQREENGTKAVIHLTTQKAETSEATFRNATINSESCLVGNNATPSVVTNKNNVKAIRGWPGTDEEVYELIDDGTAVKLDDNRTEYSIYAWIDNDTGTVYWWSDAVNVYVTSGSRLFRNLPSCTTIDVTGFNTSRMTDMSYMFYNDNSLMTLDLRSFDTSNATSMSHMFRECQKLVNVDLRRFDTSMVTNMEWMFYDCYALTSLDLSSFDTSVVRSMSAMFYNCNNLTDLDVTNFDTSAVENMSSMFAGCSAITELDVTNFDTSTCVTMGSMFSGCKLLTELDVRNFDTSSVTDMGGMFSNCQGIASIDLSNFDTSSVYNMSSMFSNCISLTRLDLSGFDTSSVNNMGSMFYNCKLIVSLDLGSFDTSSVNNMREMFNACNKLENLNLSSFDTSSVCDTYDMYRMFQSCYSLTTLDLSSFDCSSARNMYQMFNGCSGLTSIDFGSNFDASSCINMAYMFNGCSKLESLNLSSFHPSSCVDMSYMFSGNYNLVSINFGSNFDTSCVTNMNSMFSSCNKLADPDLSSFNTSLVTDMGSMFAYCYALRNPDLRSFDTSNVINMGSMFSNCYLGSAADGIHSVTFADDINTSNVIYFGSMFTECRALTDPGISKFNTSSAITMDVMFKYCSSLKSLDLSGFDTSHVTTMAAMFQNCLNLETLNVSEFNTSACTNMSSMFQSCKLLTSLDISSFDTSSVTTMANMFYDCPLLETLSIDTAKFDTSHVTNMASMFNSCYKLTSIDVSHFNTSRVTEMQSMFAFCNELTQIDVSGFVTSRVTNMDSMFRDCKKVSVLDVSGFKTSKVTSFALMFSNCNKLTGLNVSGFDTSKATSMSAMFNGCNLVPVIDVSHFDTSLCTNMDSMFNGCSAVTSLDVSGFNTGNVLAMGSMFNGCKLITGLDLSGFDTTTVTSMSGMFSNCIGLTELDLSRFDTSALNNTNYMFSSCSNLEKIYVSDWWNVNFVTSSSGMFSGCNYLEGESGFSYLSNKVTKDYACVDTPDTPGYMTYKNDPSHWVNDGVCFRGCLNSDENNSTSFLSKVVAVGSIKAFAHYNGTEDQAQAIISGGGAVRVDDLKTEHYIYAWNSGGTVYWWSDTDKVYLEGGSSSMFCNLSACTKIDLTGINTSHMTSMRRMFDNCSALTTITFGDGFDTSLVNNMFQMFKGCSALKTLDISSFAPVNVLTMEEMFNGCTAITSITLGSAFHAEKVRRMRNMFFNCKALTTMDTSGFFAADVYDMYQMFMSCNKLTAINLTNFNCSDIIFLNSTFNECQAVKSITFGSFVTTKATSMYRMFRNCKAINTTLDLRSFKAPEVTDMSDMFTNCTAPEILFDGFDASSCTTMLDMFYSCSQLTALDLSSFTPSECTTMVSMFYNCNQMKTLDIPNFSTARCTNMVGMFQSCSWLTELSLGSRFDTSKCINMASMFQECTRLVTLDIGSLFNTSECTSMASMFNNCQALTGVSLSGFDTSRVTNMASMFYNNRATLLIDVSSFVTSKVTTMNQMFRSCIKAAEIRINPAKFDTSRVVSMYWMFRDDNALATLDTSGFRTPKTTDMSYMFNACYPLTELDLSGFDTSKAVTMAYMFNGCYGLTSLNLSRFNTSRVVDVSSMFGSCSKLTTLDLSGFDVSSCGNMASMFNGCTNLETLTLGQLFDTHEVVHMNHMFNGCTKLQSIDLSRFDTHEVIYMNNMFCSCYALTDLDLSSFDTHEVTNMASMFEYCRDALTSITFGPDFSTAEVYNFQYMFSNCQKLQSLDLSRFDTHEAVYMQYMFNSCFELETLLLSENFKTAETVYMQYMFNACYKLQSLDLSSFDTNTVTNMSYMFTNCRALTELDLSSFVTPKAWTMQSMFQSDGQLETLDVSNFDTRRVATMDSMFYGCSKLRELDLSSFDTPKLIRMSNMFRECSLLESVLVPNFNTEKVTTMGMMFYYCKSLRELDLSSFETPELTNMDQMFNGCLELESLDVSNFDTSKVTTMGSLFANCNKLVSLDLESFNTQNVTNMSSMFYNCFALEELNVENFFTSNVTTMAYMFYYCRAIPVLDLSSFDTSKVKDMAYMFHYCSELTTIYVSNYWNTDEVTNGSWMFRYDYKLVGGNGTRYGGAVNPSYSNQHVYNNTTYAKIDSAATDESPAVEGYLTYKTPAVNNSTDISSEDPNCLVEPITDSICIYTFTGLNPNVQYYAWEEDIADENYIESHLYDSPLEVRDLTGTITNRLITYDDEETEYGSLSIKKVLKAESGAELTEADEERMFVFTITLTDENNDPLSGESLIGGILFTDGTANVRIPGGATLMLDYIPSGYHYSVTEEEVVLFTSSGKNESGEIETDIISRVVYTNTKSAVIEKVGSVTLKKLVTGIYELEEDFLFTISFTGLHPEEVYSLSDGTEFTTDRRGAAVIDLVLENGGEITVPDLPVGSSYRITEAGGDFIPSYFITDANDSGTIIQPTGSNTRSGLSLSTTVEYVDEDEDITVTFTNSKNKRENVILKKVLENASGTNFDTFTFTAELRGLSPEEVIGTSLGLRTADSNGDLTMTFEMSADEEIIFYDLPVGSQYRFTEAGNEWNSSYRLTNSGTGGSIFSSFRTVDEVGNDLSTALETVNENEQITAQFTNTKLQRDITVTKIVDAYGSDISYAEYSSQRFRYLISFTGLESEKTYNMQYTRMNYTGIEDIGSFTASQDGKADVTVYLTHGLSVKIKNLPKESKYTVTEYPAINYISSYEITGNEGAVIVKDSDRNRKTCRILSTATETVDEAELDMNIVFTNRYYNDPTARVCTVTIEKEIDTKIEAFGTPTFIFRLKNLDEAGQDFTCSITLDGNKLVGSETLSVTRGHYLVEEIAVGRYASDGAEYLSGTTATQLKINDSDVEAEEYVADGRSFQFYLNMTDGEPDAAYLKFYNKLANYSGVSHTSFALNRVA